MAEVSAVRHYGGFLAGGSLAFIADMGLFQLLHGWLGVALPIARLMSIAVAMVVSWLINRTITFAMPGPPRVAEFLRFAAVAWMSSVLNYAVFIAILFTRPQTFPAIAIAAATAVAMTVSYLGMRVAVFRKP